MSNNSAPVSEVASALYHSVTYNGSGMPLPEGRAMTFESLQTGSSIRYQEG